MACISRLAAAILSGETELALGTIRVKIDLKEEGCDTGDWIVLAEDRDQWRAYVREVMKLRVP